MPRIKTTMGQPPRKLDLFLGWVELGSTVRRTGSLGAREKKDDFLGLSGGGLSFGGGGVSVWMELSTGVLSIGVLSWDLGEDSGDSLSFTSSGGFPSPILPRWVSSSTGEVPPGGVSGGLVGSPESGPMKLPQYLKMKEYLPTATAAGV
jgi:hypothetical protein